MVISNKPLRFLVAILVAFLPLLSTANPVVDSTKVEVVAHEGAVAHEGKQEGAHAEPQDVKSEIKEFINHHLLDSHSFNFNANKETAEHYGFSLPIILWDNGLQVFSSAEFHHGPVADVAEHNGNFYKLHHEKIYKNKTKGTMIEALGHLA